MRAIHGNSSRTLRRIFRSINGPSVRFRSFKQTRRHAHGFFSNRANSGFVEYVQARLAGIQRGNVRRAIQIAEGVLAGIYRASLKCKGALVRKPARDHRLQLRAQILSHVEIAHAWSAAQPFQHATACKIRAETLDINRNRPSSLEEIKDNVRPHAMRLLDDCSRIHDVSASE